MLVAHNKDGNRIYANSEERYKECFCPECGRPLTHKKGEIKAPHFYKRASLLISSRSKVKKNEGED